MDLWSGPEGIEGIEWSQDMAGWILQSTCAQMEHDPNPKQVLLPTLTCELSWYFRVASKECLGITRSCSRNLGVLILLPLPDPKSHPSV